MEPPPRNNYFYFLGVCQVEIRSEFVQGVAPEAKEGHVEEGDLDLMDDMNHEGNIDHKGDQEGNIDHGNHEGGGGHWET